MTVSRSGAVCQIRSVRKRRALAMTASVSGMDSIQLKSSLRFLPVSLTPLPFCSVEKRDALREGAADASVLRYLHPSSPQREHQAHLLGSTNVLCALLGGLVGSHLLGDDYEPLEEEGVHFQRLLVRAVSRVVGRIIVPGGGVDLVGEAWSRCSDAVSKQGAERVVCRPYRSK